MRKHIQIGKRSLEISTSARRAWNDAKLFIHRNSKHFVWWKLSIEYKSDWDCYECKDTYETPSGNGCPECCMHEFDSSEGGMCLNCNRDDYYNFINEDYGLDR